MRLLQTKSHGLVIEAARHRTRAEVLVRTADTARVIHMPLAELDASRPVPYPHDDAYMIRQFLADALPGVRRDISPKCSKFSH